MTPEEPAHPAPRGSYEIPEAAILDCGVGNLFSISCALQNVGLDTKIISSSRGLRNADAIVLPGVGNFKAGSRNLQILRHHIVTLVETGVPLLGVCLGMQLLFEKSQESLGDGLSLLEGRVLRLPGSVKTPHMGWNTLEVFKPDGILDGVDGDDHFYFVHSYYADPEDKEVVVAETDYGLSFASVIARDNVYGTQFHPEKSGRPGELVLRNFAEIVKR
ncbi:MAG: imidazole glycerol phosphate synthase subunit HisH [Nitrososphaeria archaeon]